MADGGKDSQWSLAHPIEEGDVNDLRAQLVALRARVSDLERENERLQLRVSHCRCWKDKTATFHDSASRSLETTSPSDPGKKGIQSIKVVELAKSFSSCNSVKQPLANGEDQNSVSCENQGPGCNLRSLCHHPRRYIALKVMYSGQRFYGFASEAQMDPTIESEIFKALERTKLLVGNKGESEYSRCGRTDKGVSSTGQVISLYLRSKLKVNEANLSHGMTTPEDNCGEELDYVKVLNRVLPKEIRVLGWCPISTDFHARFSCLSREYRYLFWGGDLKILAMQEAANKFIGEHDFRNFCKMDAANVTNYRRRITSFQITCCEKRFEKDELWAMTIKGSAFLWHQVRCMVAVLFMIGQGLESPNVVDALLDIEETPRKPQYNMASELPLVLRFCEFKDLNFICSSDARRALQEHLKNEFQTCILQAAIFQEAMDCLPVPEGSSSEYGRKGKVHVPLKLRPTEPSYEERRAKLRAKSVDESTRDLHKEDEQLQDI